MKTKLMTAGLTDSGKERAENQDFHAAAAGNFGNVSIMCDGMGSAGGALAAQAAAEAIKAHFIRLPGSYNESEELGRAFTAAEAAVAEIVRLNPDLTVMGPSALAVLVKDDRAFAAHLGSCRAYLIREDTIKRLTKDHSEVQQLIDAGTINSEQAARHPGRNIITRMLGARGHNTAEYTDPFRLYRNDVLLLCSDGLTRHVNDRQILEAVKRNNLHDACRILIKLANIGGGEDNITVQLIRVTNGRMLPLKAYRKKIKPFLSIFIPLAALISSVIFFSSVETPDILIKETDPATDSKFPEKVSFSGRAAAASQGRQNNTAAPENSSQQLPVPQKTIAEKNTAPTVKFRIIKPGTNVRANPGTHSASVAVLAPGSTIYNSSESRADQEGEGGLKWYKIKLEGGLEGWVRSDRFAVIK